MADKGIGKQVSVWGHFHDDDIWLQLPECVSFSLLNLSNPNLRFEKQQTEEL